jgi:hypothetical protein
MLEAVITFLIWLLILGLVFYLVVWVLGILGVPIPPRAVQIVGAIIFLILLLWFVQALLGGGSLPRIGRL